MQTENLPITQVVQARSISDVYLRPSTIFMGKISTLLQQHRGYRGQRGVASWILSCHGLAEVVDPKIKGGLSSQSY